MGVNIRIEGRPEEIDAFIEKYFPNISKEAISNFYLNRGSNRGRVYISF